MHHDPSIYSPQVNLNPQFPEQEHLNCPRCDSSNTKFCYYNNYNLSQPRYYCKNCRRYWTKGGTLRNIPVGGGIRKSNKRSSNSNKSPGNSSSSPTSPATPPPPPPLPPPQAQLKPELSPIFSFGTDRSKMSTRSFDSLLRSNSNSNLNKRTSDSSSSPTSPATPPPPPPPAQLKPELSPSFSFGNDRSEMSGGSFDSLLRSNQVMQFGPFGSGSEENGVIGAPASGGFRRSIFSMNSDHNESGSGGGRGESSGCDGGNCWTNLSIFTSGSNSH